jgi:hypothetical protein
MSDAEVRQRIYKDEIAGREIAGDEIAQSLAAAPAATVSTELLQTAADPTLTEDLALSLLKRADLHPQVLERLAKNASVMKSRKAKMALASHPHTPRHVSVPLARQFYTFDLMKVALSPGVPADVKIAVDDVLVARLETVTMGERLTLARRASGRVAAALLLNVENADGKVVKGNEEGEAVGSKIIIGKAPSLHARVMQAALDNPRLTEALVISSVLRADAGPALVQAVARHAKWSPRKEIRAALLRTEHLSLARALEFARMMTPVMLPEILQNSRLPERIRQQILRECLGGNALGANMRH